MQDYTELFKAINIYMNRQHVDVVRDAVVVQAPNSGTAQIKVGGATRPQPALVLSETAVSAGDRVVVLRSPRSNSWIVIGSVQSASNSANVVGSVSESWQMAPPNNFQSIGGIPGMVLLQWDVPYQQPLAFDVQIDANQNNGTAVRVLTTRGSYAILDIGDSASYARIRSISPKGRFSEWSSWLQVLPEPQTQLPGGHIEATFDYTNPSITLLWTPEADAFLREVLIEITAPFTDGTTLSVGGPGAKDLYFPKALNIPQEAGIYHVEPLYTFFDADAVNLYIEGTTPQAGSGRIVLYY